MSRKTHRFGHAEDIIREYPENVKKLAERRGEIIHATHPKPEVLISGKGRTGDHTANVGIRLATDVEVRYLTDAKHAVDCALEDFKCDPRYEQLYKLIDLFYWKGTHTIIGAALETNYSKRQAIRLKNRFVKDVMSYMGW